MQRFHAAAHLGSQAPPCSLFINNDESLRWQRSPRYIQLTYLQRSSHLWPSVSGSPAPHCRPQCGKKAYKSTGKQYSELAWNAAPSSCCPSQAGQDPPAGTPQPDAGLYSSGFEAARNPRAPLLSRWRENLAILTGNRLPGDEKVFLKLGQQLLEERQEVSSHKGSGAGLGLGLHLRLLQAAEPGRHPVSADGSHEPDHVVSS